MSKGRLALLAILGLLVVTASGSQVWLVGTTNDAVLGASQVSATGSQAAPGAVGLAVVVLAAIVAAMVTGRRVRRVVTVVGLLAALGQVVHVVLAATAPGTTLGPLAAAAVGRSGSLPVAGRTLTWAWVGVGGGALLLAAAALSVIAVGRWPAPTSRYERPQGFPASSTSSTAPTSSPTPGVGGLSGADDEGPAGQVHPVPSGEVAGPRGQRTHSDWDSLSEGHDPTDVPEAPPT